MPDYVNKALKKLNHTKPLQPQNVPSVFHPPNYGKLQQMVEERQHAPTQAQQI